MRTGTLSDFPQHSSSSIAHYSTISVCSTFIPACLYAALLGAGEQDKSFEGEMQNYTNKGNLFCFETGSHIFNLALNLQYSLLPCRNQGLNSGCLRLSGKFLCPQAISLALVMQAIIEITSVTN